MLQIKSDLYPSIRDMRITTHYWVMQLIGLTTSKEVKDTEKLLVAVRPRGIRGGETNFSKYLAVHLNTGEIEV
jgi:hypothetical protein